MEEYVEYLERWAKDLSEAEPVSIYLKGVLEERLYFPQHHYKVGFRRIREEDSSRYKEFGGSLEGLKKEDIPYFVDRLLEREEDHRIEIKPLDHSYALDWESLEVEESGGSKSCESSQKFDRLRCSLLHSSPRKHEPEFRDIIERRIDDDSEKTIRSS